MLPNHTMDLSRDQETSEGDDDGILPMKNGEESKFSHPLVDPSQGDTLPRSNKETSRRPSTSLLDLFHKPPTDPQQTDSIASDNNTTEAQQQPPSESSQPSNEQASFSKPPPVPKRPSLHQRSVSWGADVNFKEPSTLDATTAAPSSLQQPKLECNTSSEHQQNPTGHRRLESSASFRPLLHSRQESTRSLRRFQLEEVAGPFEQEAETFILKALEQQHQQRPRANTTGTTIFTNVPDQVVHDFTDSPGSSWEINISQDASADDDNLSRPESIRSQSKQPLIRPSHQRQKSVEHTLQGLTTEMMALHGQQQQEEGDTTTSTLLPGSSEPLMNEEQQRPKGGSADQLAHNAMLLSEDRPPNRSRTSSLPTLQEDQQNEDASGDSDIEAGQTSSDEDSSEQPKVPKKGRVNRWRRSSVMAVANDKLKEDFELWRTFFRPRRRYFYAYIKHVLMYWIIPITGIAAILFYLADNPPSGKNPQDPTKASASWWLLFIGVRQVITLSLSLATQAFIIDFLALGTRALLNFVGPIITLLIVQSKGWPFIFFWWGIIDFCMLYGDGPFARHWLYWQDAIDMCNESNPDGGVVSNDWNFRILTIAVCVSAVVAVKRFVIGLYLGRQTFSHYGEQLASLMNRMLLVSQVAGVAKEIEKDALVRDMDRPMSPPEHFDTWDGDICFRSLDLCDEDREDSSEHSPRSRRSLGGTSGGTSERIINTNARDPLTGSLHSSERTKLMQLLGQWEEPERKFDRPGGEQASISAVLNFRKALTFIQKSYPFSIAFGPADSREACIDSAQQVYERLLMRTPGEEDLKFETLVSIALNDDGTIDQEKTKDLVRLFRPDRQGNLTMLDFVKSVDSVYKEFRLLNASISNSSQIDRAFENIINVVFYVIVITIILTQLGFDPLALFLSLSSVILAFAFMIGSASAKYFEGILFILVRRPYNIGDRIHVSGVETDTSFDGAPGWVVENVTLFQTTAIWGPTNERCSLSNGSLASSRIINGARSPRAQFHIFIKLPIDTPYEKILIFKSAIEEFMKARPREWLSLNGFRANRLVADQGYVEYAIVIQHRDSWQNTGQLLDSKANLSSFCLEVASQLEIHYRAPPLPVDLKYSQAADPPVSSEVQGMQDVDSQARAEEFRSIALNKHNIRLS